MTTEKFIEKSRNIHGEQYEYDHVFYIRSKDKVKIKCLLHGIFEQQPALHLQGYGCFQCGRFKSLKAMNESWQRNKKQIREKTTNTLIERYGVDHPSRINQYGRGNAKRKITFQERYGGHPMKDEIIKAKNRQTWSKKTNEEISSIMTKKSVTFQERYGYSNPFLDDDIKQQIEQKNIANGQWSKCRTEFDQYRCDVLRFTERSYKKYKNIINPDSQRRSRDYHLDHIYSITEGFNNDVPAEIISHYSNLRIIESKANLVKSSKSAKTLAELYCHMENAED